ncbi:MAG TPA: DUF4394 domain-containing protein [Gemmatimonadales bacterium]|nr:DUF4394 domain-containing protein [Gemmatimonadales bacterium]
MPSTTPLRRLLSGTSLAVLALLGACGGDSGDPTGPGPAPTPQPPPMPSHSIQGRAIFGLTCANQLVLFGSGNPGSLARQVAIGGMPAGEEMLAIDFGADALYGVGSDSRVYAVDTLTGAATPVGGAFTPAASGAHFGLAFSAGENRLRLSSVESNQNQSLDPVTGTTGSADADLAYAAGDAHAATDPALSAAAYHGATLYGIETNANTLVTAAPASGQLTTVSDLPFNVYLCSGLDIDADGTAYAALATDNGSELYTIDLASGSTTLLGGIAGSPVHSIALRP